MTEAEARGWIAQHYSTAAVQLLSRFVDLLSREADHQNLISASTREAIWSRHIADSAQLLDLASAANEGDWIDIGSGAGLPGLVIACLTERPIVLVEPRRRRVEFLIDAARELNMATRVTIIQHKSERVQLDRAASVISARAVSALPQLLESAVHLADRSTLWLLPKGQSVASEVAEVQRTWHGVFHVKPSITDPRSGIIVAQGVYRR